jgi:hypothetical protein
MKMPARSMSCAELKDVMTSFCIDINDLGRVGEVAERRFLDWIFHKGNNITRLDSRTVEGPVLVDHAQ